MAEGLGRHDDILAETVGKHGGSLLKPRGEGDSTFSVFDRATAAFAAALSAQVALGDQGWPEGTELSVRMATRKTSDNTLQLSEYIKLNFVPRSLAMIALSRRAFAAPPPTAVFRPRTTREASFGPRGIVLRKITGISRDGHAKRGFYVFRRTAVLASANGDASSGRDYADPRSPRRGSKAASE
jgi:hypothetical protein